MTGRFICAIISSDSKSDTTRRPFTMKSASSSLARSTTRLANIVTETFGQWATDSWIIACALVEVEEGVALLRVAHGGDDHLVEVARRHLDDVEVAVVQGVERPRVEDPGHGRNATAGPPRSPSSVDREASGRP